MQKDLQSGKKEKKFVYLELDLATEQKASKQRTECGRIVAKLKEFWEEAANIICSNQFSFNKGTKMLL